MLRFICFFLLSFFLFFTATPPYAASTEWEKTNEISTRLIAGSYGNSLKLGFHSKMAAGWHTYWHTPGDGGKALSADFSKSENIKSFEIKWPAPERIVVYDSIENFVYSDEVILPVIITPENPSKPIKLNVMADYATCEEICIFLRSEFLLDILPEQSDQKNEQLIDKFLAKIPKTNGADGLNIEKTEIVKNKLQVTASNSWPFSSPDVFIEGSKNFRFPRAEVSFSENRKKAKFLIPYETLLGTAELAGENLTVTLKDGSYAVEKNITVPPVTITGMDFLFVLFVAFIGGLILNIMPCVLPVLSLKLMSVMRHSGKHSSHIRFSFLMSAAGIISSFLILAFIVIALKSAGSAVGWGFQFQEPLFLIFLIFILNLFAANQMGLFEVRLPSFIGDAINDKLQDDKRTARGHFLTGAFATLLATPCSAPFLGTAISFALSQGVTEIIITFIFMGLGLAFPYFLFALLPNLISKMPKPGAWMIKAKYFLGFLLVATSVWLIWVLSHQLGMLSAIVLATLSAGMLLLFFEAKKKAQPASPTLILILALSSFYLPVLMAQKESVKINEEDLWVAFEQEKIPELVKQGKVVFVDVTADWCLTCKFNKATTLSRGEVMSYLNRPDVIAMKADYTSPSQEITDYLVSFGRYGIPFNVVYGPNAPDGITLSELLTTSSVIEAIEKAGGK